MTTIGRRGFLGGVASAALATTYGAHGGGKPFIWAQLVHLGTNMWGNDRITPRTVEDGERTISKTLLCDDSVWRRVLGRIVESGANTIVIDVGDGVVFPSHPEIAVNGAWTPEKLSAEVAKIRKAGLEPVPKLNFSTTRDQWLKVYNRMVGTLKYYEVCRDVIGDVCDIFGRPGLFHIGMDGECMEQKRSFMGYGTFRDREFWFKDVKFYADELEKRGVRAWMWADSADDWPDEYVAQCPKSILQSVAGFRNPFDSAGAMGIKPILNTRQKSLARLDKSGFETVLAGFGGSQSPNGDLAGFMDSSRRQGLEHVVGGLQTSWSFMLPGDGGEKANMDSITWLEEAIKSWNA